MDIENQVREIDMKQCLKYLIFTMYNKEFFFLTKAIFYIVNYFYHSHKIKLPKTTQKNLQNGISCQLSYDYKTLIFQ